MNFMWNCVAILALVALVLGGGDHEGKRNEWAKKMKEMAKACMEETGATADEAKAAIHGKSQETEYSSAQKCLMKCMLEKKNVLDAEKNLQIPPWMQDKAPAEKLEVFTACAAKIGPVTTCDQAVEARKCFEEVMPMGHRGHHRRGNKGADKPAEAEE